MTLIRLSDIDHDRQLLINLDHIIEVSTKKGDRGLAENAVSLIMTLSNGNRSRVYPIDADGRFDPTTNDESTVIWNFQQAAAKLRRTNEQDSPMQTGERA